MSKGLEAQDIIIDMFNKYANKSNDEGEFFKFCNADGVIKKELKALEIIKKKEVNVYDLKECSKYEYNKRTKEELQELTQEEFELLKEVLENE